MYVIVLVGRSMTRIGHIAEIRFDYLCPFYTLMLTKPRLCRGRKCDQFVRSCVFVLGFILHDFLDNCSVLMCTYMLAIGSPLIVLELNKAGVV